MILNQPTAEFETFHGELKSFLLRMTASVQDKDMEELGLTQVEHNPRNNRMRAK